MEKSKSASPDFSVRDFFKRFPNDEACLEHIFNVRFGERHECRACGVESTFHQIGSADKRKNKAMHAVHGLAPLAGITSTPPLAQSFKTHAHRCNRGFMRSISL